MAEKPLSVIFGAGNVGRGFLAQLFTESGYRVTFVDVVEPVVRALAERGWYTLQLVTDENVTEYRINDVTALFSSQVEAVAAALATCEIAATAVGVGALPKIAPVVAAGLEHRRQLGNQQLLNIIICENLRNAPDVFAGMLRQHLSPEGQAYLESSIGLVDTVISRMVPIMPPEVAAKDPSLSMAEPYKRLPVNRARFKGQIPEVVGMEPRDNFIAYVDRKLYTHNAGHAMIAYVGYLRGYEYGYQALDDPFVGNLTRAALRESSAALVAKHGFTPEEQNAHVEDLLERFRNHRLGDTIFRLGRDPLRKLSYEDRLVGAARLVLEMGGTPDALAWGIAAGFRFAPKDDPSAQKLQTMLKEQPLPVVIETVCSLAPGSILSEMIAARYQALLAGQWNL